MYREVAMNKREIRTNLTDMRTHLTVANLATAQLRRKSPRTEESARLFAHLDRALTQIAQDTRRMERTLDDAPEGDRKRASSPFRVLFGMAAATALAAAKVRQLTHGQRSHQLLRSLP